ncbi:hypothetical protein LY624_20145 [Pseudoalteromonas sp. N1230-9]|uniref:hypothetical protein n=1 Tax=Pseudoalteromonas sp. N1230-9 TaxID=2907156 RepID=UPI002B2802C4|nr:hypothetical protein LY624_20145 [Pseudoalteromonas sp. N1230-9]
MLSIDKLFEELLRLREADECDTENFNLYTHDQICEKIQEKTNLLGDSFIKYESISYIVQGPRDQGVDVLLKITPEDEPEKYVGIQVKSYNEINDKNNDLSKQLKAGYHDARYHYSENMERYYIILCGDSKKNSKRISAITNEFSKEKNVRVIGARYAFNFINLSPQTIAALVDTFLRKEDYVRSRAKQEVIEYKPHELYFVLCCLTQVLEKNNATLDAYTLHDIIECKLWERFSDVDFSEILENLSEIVLERSAYSDDAKFRIEFFPALRAMYYDLKVRYKWPEDEMLEHLYEAFRLE